MAVSYVLTYPPFRPAVAVGDPFRSSSEVALTQGRLVSMRQRASPMLSSPALRHRPPATMR